MAGIPLVWVARVGHALLLRLLLADHAARRPDRDARRSCPPPLPNPCSATPPRPLPSETQHALRTSFRSGGRPRWRWRCRPSPRTRRSTPRGCRPRTADFSFEGPFGTYDRGALQRGFQVYKEVCSACHGLNHVAFHNLDEAGGPGFTEAQAKAHRRRLQDPGRSQRQGRDHRRQGRCA